MDDNKADQWGGQAVKALKDWTFAVRVPFSDG